MPSPVLAAQKSTATPAPLFLVGIPRAGTTLAQSWLMSTGAIGSFPETHAFSQLSTHKSRLKQSLGNLRAFLLFFRFARASKLRRLPRPFLSYRQGAHEIAACLAATACAEGYDFWLEKTPGHLHEINLIRATVPGARFILIYRSAAPNIASLIKAEAQWQRQAHRTSEAGAIARWMGDRARIALLEAECPEDVCILSYEALISDAQAQAAHVGAFLGLAPEFFKPIHTLQNQAAKVVTARETWKANNTAEKPQTERQTDPALAEKLSTVFAAYARESEILAQTIAPEEQEEADR